MRTGYSQNDEQAVILRLIGSHPPAARRFLDIGAHDGVTFSNTRRLAELGWGGTLVEPSPAAFSALTKNYSGRGDVTLVNAAVTPGPTPPTIEFYDSGGDMVSTTSDQHLRLWSGRSGHTNVLPSVAPKVAFRKIQVDALSVADLLQRFPGPYAVVNVDVEGTNLEIFVAMPLREMGCVVACVEYQDKRADITRLASRQGYSVEHATSENLILRRT